ncbi:MAG: hypothetical protein GFH27_549333n124 [Chloroflexi bacterium AL-W]|nr:hypothetical protein [Chloroflexi bacterium AL-N1]NOK70423.1 hypothetical protein [Chloroflexi bacterium AL-N10]NOK78218.1 hypothetical protein [Chloroflexi bacterium AL-N5]NOK85317.1 hypothetical protein [Chloroflexi bacterium AL-W]NOK92082.1 hypothetical protein [Chloroflexi bacterium AL-N15]
MHRSLFFRNRQIWLYIKSMTNNLPNCRNALIGREDLLELTTQLLLQHESGIVTLAGPAGVGKTRLAQALAQQLSFHFTDGVWCVPLEGITDVMMVLPTIIHRLGIHIPSRQQPIDALVQFLRTRKVLLILDNLEHIITSAPDIAHLIEACQRLTILATTHIPLAVRAEQIVTVMPLDLPDASRTWDVAALQKIAAVQLFVQRVQLRNHMFVLTATNTKAVIDICTRMDGLPLALELAAACIPSLGVEMIRAHLDRVLPLPVIGFQDMPERHQSLDVAITISYELLTPLQQALFRQLSVFVGRFTLEAVLEVFTPLERTSEDTLAALMALVHQHLVSIAETPSQHHYYMLETIRSFAHRCLAAHAEITTAYEKLCDYLCRVVAHQKPPTIMHVDEGWLQRIETWHNSMIGLLVWTTSTDQWFERRTQLIVDLIPYWTVHGQLLEAQRWLDAVSKHPELPRHPPLHIDVLNGNGLVLAHRGLPDQAYQYHQQAFNLCTTYNEQEKLVYTIKRIGYILDVRGQHHEAMHMHERSLALAHQLNDDASIADAHMNVGHLLHELGNEEEAKHALERSIQVARKIGAKRILAWSWIGLGHVDRTQQHDAAAHQNYDRARLLFSELHDQRGIAWSTINLSVMTARQGQAEHALALADESLRRFQTVHDQRGTAWAYYHLSHIHMIHKCYTAASDALCQAFQHTALRDDSQVLLFCLLQQATRLMIEQTQFAQAVRFLGLADSLHSQDRTSDTSSDARETATNLIDHLRAQISKAQFTTLWHEGRRLRLDDVSQILRDIPDTTTENASVVRILTRRELDVLRAVAEGLSNQQIASHLTISTGTVRTHLNTIYDKLDVQSRTAAVHSARKLGMLT